MLEANRINMKIGQTLGYLGCTFTSYEPLCRHRVTN